MKLQLQDIPFNEFQKFLVEANVDVCGDAENAERLYIEFTDITASPVTQSLVDIENNIQFYSLKISTIQVIIDAMRQQYSAELAEILRNDFDFDYEFSEDSFESDLKKVVTECTMYTIQLEENLKEKDRIEKSMGGGNEKISYKYYTEVTNAISKYIGYHIPDDINTLRWATLYKQLIDNINKTQQDGARPN